MKNILILANSLNGLYNFRGELVQELINKGNKVIISAPDNQRSTYFIDMGCTFINTPINSRSLNPLKDINVLYKYYKIIKRTKPDVVLTYTIKPNIYGGMICKWTKTPYLVNITGLGSAVENKGIIQKISLFLYKRVLKNAKVVFFQNEGNRDFMKRHNIATTNNKVIPGSGVNLKRFTPLPYPKEDNVVRFLFIGRVMREKGIDQYLEAAKKIKEIYPNTEFHIIGRCVEDYLEKLKSFEKQGYIKYHGAQKNVSKFIQMTHCTIHPSYYPEGMSNVLLESAASARPIITTDRNGCKEIVDINKNGFIFKQKDTDDLLEKIICFLKLTNKEKILMGETGAEKVKKSFDRNLVIKEYMKEIDNI